MAFAVARTMKECGEAIQRVTHGAAEAMSAQYRTVLALTEEQIKSAEQASKVEVAHIQQDGEKERLLQALQARAAERGDLQN